MKKYHVVLGAGAAGLAAAWELVEKGHANVLVLERNSRIGGLLSYHEKKGNKYEYGTHVFHTDNEELRSRVLSLMGDRFFEFDREGKLQIKFRDKYFRYPLNGIDIIRNLPFALMAKALASFVVSSIKWFFTGREPVNSAEVLEKHFGKALYEIFFKDYTHKFWGRPCDELDKNFALERIPRSDVLKILHDIIEKLGFGKMFSGHNLTERAIGQLYYSKRGINELPEIMAALIKSRKAAVKTNVVLKGINIAGGRIVSIEYAVNGSKMKAEVESVVSTIPIRHLMPLLSPTPEKSIINAASKLTYLPLVVCGLLVNRKSVRDAICTYFRTSIFNRLSEPTFHGLETVPPGKSILLAEMTDFTLQQEGVETEKEIINRVIDDLVDEEIIKRDEIVDTCLFRYEEAYPIYHIGFQDDLKKVADYLASLANIYSTGRQGAFCYVNIHATMQMAINTVRTMVGKSK